MSNLAPPPQAYRQSAVLAATPAQLVVMLYDGARRFLRQAGIAMRGREIERAHNALRRAELIIAYLDGILDHDQPNIPERLHPIYVFCLEHLNRARMNQDASKVDEVSDLLGELRESWVQVAEEAARAGAA